MVGSSPPIPSTDRSSPCSEMRLHSRKTQLRQRLEPRFRPSCQQNMLEAQRQISLSARDQAPFGVPRKSRSQMSGATGTRRSPLVLWLFAGLAKTHDNRGDFDMYNIWWCEFTISTCCTMTNQCKVIPQPPPRLSFPMLYCCRKVFVSCGGL